MTIIHVPCGFNHARYDEVVVPSLYLFLGWLEFCRVAEKICLLINWLKPNVHWLSPFCWCSLSLCFSLNHHCHCLFAVITGPGKPKPELRMPCGKHHGFLQIPLSKINQTNEYSKCWWLHDTFVALGLMFTSPNHPTTHHWLNHLTGQLVSHEGVPQLLDGFYWEILFKWMIWRYPHFRNPPYMFHASAFCGDTPLTGHHLPSEESSYAERQNKPWPPLSAEKATLWWKKSCRSENRKCCQLPGSHLWYPVVSCGPRCSDCWDRSDKDQLIWQVKPASGFADRPSNSPFSPFPICLFMIVVSYVFYIFVPYIYIYMDIYL